MPRYLTRPELLERRRLEQLQRLASDEAGQLDTARVDQAIADAESEVTSYLAGRYGGDLPATPANASDALKRLVADLVPYHLAKGAPHVAEALLEEHGRAIAALRDIARGLASLDLPAAPATDTTEPRVAVKRPASDAKLTLETLVDW